MTGLLNCAQGMLERTTRPFDSLAEVDEPSRGLRLEAAEGMRLFRSAEADAADAPVLVLGSGDVSVAGKAEEAE